MTNIEPSSVVFSTEDSDKQVVKLRYSDPETGQKYGLHVQVSPEDFIPIPEGNEYPVQDLIPTRELK